jgi:hypothetical protein
MSFWENLLSSIIVVIFFATIIFYNFESDQLQYDCSKLHTYRDLPEEVVKECIRIISPSKHSTHI